MKKVIFLVICYLTTVVTLSVSAAAMNPGNQNTKSAFALSARKASGELSSLLPGKTEVVEGTTAHQFNKILCEARALAAKVQKAGNRMTDSQYQSFQRELRVIESRLDQLQISTATANTPSQSDCFNSCNKQYKGWDGSNGWNRFWCKASCFRISVYANS